ncbi:MAG: septal ring lytic transglycosylase RlpA family protein [Pseudomonadota bacterium]|nr:septal ring lytic transglycosylase RlpA family protein [Pseudomonadota bacterium]
MSATVLPVYLLFAAGLVMAAGLGGCSRSGDESTKLSKRVVPIGQRAPKGGGVYKVGNPYQINGKWFHPREDPAYDQVGVASWYGDLFHGRYTANGEIFDQESLTAAHPTLPLPVYAEVTNLQNNRAIVVRVNDRGPYAHDRVIDLSRRSAEVLGFERAGTAQVRVRYLGKAPLNGDDSYERQILASRHWIRTAAGKQDRNIEVAVSKPITKIAEPGMTQRRTPQTEPAPAPVQVASAGRLAPAPVVTTASAAPASTASLAGPVAGQPLFVQAGSYRDEGNAAALRQRLAGVGQVSVYPAEISGTMYYRVRVGPFNHRSEADHALRRVQAAGQSGAHVVLN